MPLSLSPSLSRTHTQHTTHTAPVWLHTHTYIHLYNIYILDHIYEDRQTGTLRPSPRAELFSVDFVD